MFRSRCKRKTKVANFPTPGIVAKSTKAPGFSVLHQRASLRSFLFSEGTIGNQFVKIVEWSFAITLQRDRDQNQIIQVLI